MLEDIEIAPSEHFGVVVAGNQATVLWTAHGFPQPQRFADLQKGHVAFPLETALKHFGLGSAVEHRNSLSISATRLLVDRRAGGFAGGFQGNRTRFEARNETLVARGVGGEAGHGPQPAFEAEADIAT